MIRQTSVPQDLSFPVFSFQTFVYQPFENFQITSTNRNQLRSLVQFYGGDPTVCPFLLYLKFHKHFEDYNLLRPLWVVKVIF